VDLVDEEDIARFEVGEEGDEIARAIAGPEVIRRLTPISVARICARVVLPRPGGP